MNRKASLRLTGLVALPVWCTIGCSTPAQEPTHLPAPRQTAEEASERAANEASPVIANGARLFDDHCTVCHGERGEGGEGIHRAAPQVLGPKVLATAGGKRNFSNARELFDFISNEMPATNPGKLKSSEYWDIVTYMTSENGVAVERPITARTAASVRLDGAASR